MKAVKYNFIPVEQCEMCHDKSINHKVMDQRLNMSQGLSPRKKSGITVSVMQCNHCGLIYSSPLPLPENLQDHYGVPPESYWIPSYFEVSDSYFYLETITLKKLQEFHSGMKALDVGAGIGKCMKVLEKYGYDTFGFEPSIPFYTKAIEKMGISPSKLSLGQMEDVNYPADYFDFITFGAVFEHLYHPATALQKAMSWLKPGGIIHMEIPSADYLISKLINLYYQIRVTNFVTNISPMHTPFHLYEFTRKSFDLLAKKLGFEVVHEEYMVGDNPVIPKIVTPILNKIMESSNTGLQLIIWLKKL